MKHTSHFLITAKELLVEQISQKEIDSLSDLLDPLVWSGVEVDKGGLDHTDYEQLVKVLFVDTLIRERSSENGFDKVFSNVVSSDEVFDQFWDLKRVDLDWSVEDALEDAIDTGSIANIHSDNPRVLTLLKESAEK